MSRNPLRDQDPAEAEPSSSRYPTTLPLDEDAVEKMQPNPYFSLPVVTAKKTLAMTKKKNQSILKFFGKSESAASSSAGADAAPQLFFRDSQQSTRNPAGSEKVNDGAEDREQSRFNENENSVKRRRTSQDFADFIVRTPSPELNPLRVKFNTKEATYAQGRSRTKSSKRLGGFIDDSSDEGEDSGAAIDQPADDANVPMNEVWNNNFNLTSSDTIDIETGSRTTGAQMKPPNLNNQDEPDHGLYEPTDSYDNPVLGFHPEGTSAIDTEEFDDDEIFEGGEEYMEQRWMEEQREMEIGLDEDSKSESGAESVLTPRSIVEDDVRIGNDEVNGPSVCPVCDGSMRGLSETEASSHVNACLDGNVQPLPKQSNVNTTVQTMKGKSGIVYGKANPDGPGPKRFQRAAIARPAQSNPFSLAKDSNGGTAFARLMSGHAENAAWAEAAANETQSRGKPAYQRTCPFYKIMPGFFICVDAFRYGRVEGQNAYFLSHFHSDHYIGLTSSWCHGPIYASKVTCNLMLQQLNVDSKWVVPLEFERKVEVPGTKGVFVTMIPANHCPGSSLFLFEKLIGQNKDGSPRSTRILHCGDFRACPAHVSHPLLRPDVVDSVTGQTRQQVIDTCYLDTTYLTPKYSFPSQHDVIDACAQMCLGLSKETVDPGDGWERTKAEQAGNTMKNFLGKGETNTVENEDRENKEPKVRGRLLVVIGTYSIGKERICLGIAKALDSKIYAPPSKMRICACLEDPELNARLTKNPLEAQVHMQTLMEIRAETLHDYMMSYKGHFARVVGFRPTGWSYRPPTSRFTENPTVSTVLHSEGWKTRYTMRDLAPQRGSTRESNCFGVPYSEHSSFRELTMFCCALRINRIVPTVNVGSARSREKMKAWIEKWDTEKRKNGLFKVDVGSEGWGSGDGQLRYGI